MRKTAVRTAYNDSELPPDFCYLKIDVEKRLVIKNNFCNTGHVLLTTTIVFSLFFRALERWGSIEALEREKGRREEAMEEGERFRKGFYNKIFHNKGFYRHITVLSNIIICIKTKTDRRHTYNAKTKYCRGEH